MGKKDREERAPRAEGGRFGRCFAADRGGIGYHSLTPNTFTADTMINEPGAALQAMFLDPLDPLPTALLPQPPSLPLMLNPFHLDRVHLGGTPDGVSR